AAQEALDLLPREVVGELARRMLHQIRRDAGERTADAAVARDPAAAYGVDDAAGGVRAVLDRETELDLDRRGGEAATFHAQEAPLVVALPRDVVARADVDLRPREWLRQHALDRLPLRTPLRSRARPVQHVQEVGVPARVQLVGPIEHDA